jgi:Cys-rich protein (TIGR01571 family)
MDGEVCLLGTFLPCYLSARTIGRFREPGEGVDVFWLVHSLCCNLLLCAMWEARTRVQEKHNIRQGLFERCVVWCTCPHLQLCTWADRPVGCARARVCVCVGACLCASMHVCVCVCVRWRVFVCI